MYPFNQNLFLRRIHLVRFIRIVVQPVMIIIHLSVIDNILGVINTFRKSGVSI